MNNLLAILAMSAPILITGSVALRMKMGPVSLRLLLAFSAGYLFSLSIMHLMPEVFATSPGRVGGLFIVLGFCLQLVIDTFSTGIEHGHVHLHTHDCHKQLPVGIILGLYIHSFLEGLPVFDPHVLEGSATNYQLIFGLAVHNVPITIAFAALLTEHEHRLTRRLLLLVLFSLMAPFGYLLSYVLHSMGIQGNVYYSSAAYALVIGIFLQISTAILFESSDHHRYNLKKVLVMACGILLAYFIS